MAEFNTLSGLDVFEGMTVRVIGDGAYNGDYLVENGSITLNTPVTKGWVGLPYSGTLRSLPQIGGLQGGRARNARRRLDNIAVQYQGVGGWVGSPERDDQFYRLATRQFEDDIDSAVPARHAVELQQFGGGWNTEQVEVRATPGFMLRVLKMEGRYVANA